ncbi:MAG TPA: hypothetical protein VEY91_08095 [Candidatus Limnocylindria bacterium]|nr:hypothetical protein [Candidatus Limnocylindria bacterium]
MSEPNDQSPFRCFDRRYLQWVVGGAVLVIALALVGKGLERGSPLRLIVGAAQAGLVAWLVVYTVAAIRKLDELKQRIHLEAIAAAFAISGAAFSAYEMLENAGLPAVDWGEWGWPVMVLLWGIGISVASRRYR